MSNIIHDAATRSGSRPHLAKTHGTYPHTQVGDLNLRASQAVSVHRSAAMNVFNAQTLPSDCWDTPGFTDVRLTGADVINGITFRMTVQNTAAANTGRISARFIWFLINHIEILAENGSTVLERIEAEHLLNACHKLSPHAVERVRIALQGGDNDETGTTIAAGGSKTLYIPLLESVLERLELPCYALAAPVTIRIHWRGRAAFRGYMGDNVAAGSIDVTRFDAVASCFKYGSAERQALAAKFASAGLSGQPTLDLRFARPGFQRTTEALTPNSEHIIRLSSVSGLVTSIAVALVNPSSNLAIEFSSASLIEGVDLRDERGSSLNGQILDRELLRVTSEREKTTNALMSNYYFVEVPVGGVSGEPSGQLHGYIPMSGYHQLVLKLANDASGTYEVIVLYRTVAVACVHAGHITVKNS